MPLDILAVVDFRFFVEDSVHPSHRCRAAFKSIHNKTEGNHRAHEHKEIGVERHKFTNGDFFFNDMEAAHPEQHHGGDAGQKPEERKEEGHQPDLPVVPPDKLLVQLPKMCHLALLQRICLHDAHAGEILLHLRV